MSWTNALLLYDKRNLLLLYYLKTISPLYEDKKKKKKNYIAHSGGHTITHILFIIISNCTVF